MAEKLDFTIEQLTGGGKRAWDAFVDRFSPVIYAAVRKTYLIYMRSANNADINDIAQVIFIRLIKNNYRLLKTYDPSRSSLATWLTIISRSTTINLLRKKRPETVQLEKAGGANAVPPCYPASPIRMPEGLLPPRQKLVLRLLFDQNMPVKEIAALLGVKTQTVRSTRHKAIKRLRKYFRERGRGVT